MGRAGIERIAESLANSQISTPKIADCAALEAEKCQNPQTRLQNDDTTASGVEQVASGDAGAVVPVGPGAGDRAGEIAQVLALPLTDAEKTELLRRLLGGGQ